jgi:hypothetical protein
MKRLFTLIVEPLKFFASRNFAEKLSVYFSKNKVMTYLVAFVITVIIIFFAYILPNVKW